MSAFDSAHWAHSDGVGCVALPLPPIEDEGLIAMPLPPLHATWRSRSEGEGSIESTLSVPAPAVGWGAYQAMCRLADPAARTRFPPTSLMPCNRLLGAHTDRPSVPDQHSLRLLFASMSSCVPSRAWRLSPACSCGRFRYQRILMPSSCLALVSRAQLRPV